MKDKSNNAKAGKRLNRNVAAMRGAHTEKYS
jgi:hypothetical protein